MLVCGQEFTEEIVGKIEEFVTANPDVSRRDLSLRVCDWLDWKSPNGKFQEMSCRVALLKLERRGIVTLPQPHSWGSYRITGKSHTLPIWKIDSVCYSMNDLGGVHLVRIDSSDSRESKIWKALMGTYHYLGSGPLCGAQMRYLIKS